MSVLETTSGKFFDYLKPLPEQVSVADMAHALSNICRFNGHCSRHYSVAEHAVLVCHLVRERRPTDKLLALAALHHDSHEAYLGDLPTPLKVDLGGKYRKFVARADAAIASAVFPDGGLLVAMDSDVVHEADAMALRLEARELKVSRGIGEHWGHTATPRKPVPWKLGLSPYEARELFCHMHVVCGGKL